MDDSKTRTRDVQGETKALSSAARKHTESNEDMEEEHENQPFLLPWASWSIKTSHDMSDHQPILTAQKKEGRAAGEENIPLMEESHLGYTELKR